MTTRTVVWRFKDGKLGHENQTFGLLQALGKSLKLSVHDLEPETRSYLNPTSELPPPDLLVGAGHTTHIHLLLARVIYGGKTVVLMRPSLPAALFDYVLVPNHDRCRSFGNVHFTEGVLNRVQVGKKDKSLGLVLIGGESKHFGWDSEHMLGLVNQVVRNKPQLQWHICDSRRTPESFSTRLADVTNAHFNAWQNTAPGFLSTQMTLANEIWVSCDSMSMLYEAITGGAFVGVLELPGLRTEHAGKKIWRAIESLVLQGRIQLSSQGTTIDTLASPPDPLRESERCAELITSRLAL